jgi:hypothetical protein
MRITYQLYLVPRATPERNPMDTGIDDPSRTHASLLIRVRDPGD